MDREIGHNCNGSLLALDSINCWDTLEISNKDIDSLGPSISQEQLLSIVDFSPEWVCTGIETKGPVFAALLLFVLWFACSTFYFSPNNQGILLGF